MHAPLVSSAVNRSLPDGDVTLNVPAEQEDTDHAMPVWSDWPLPLSPENGTYSASATGPGDRDGDGDGMNDGVGVGDGDGGMPNTLKLSNSTTSPLLLVWTSTRTCSVDAVMPVWVWDSGEKSLK